MGSPNRIEQIRDELAKARIEPENILTRMKIELRSHILHARELAALIADDPRNHAVIQKPEVVFAHLDRAYAEAGFK